MLPSIQSFVLLSFGRYTRMLLLSTHLCKNLLKPLIYIHELSFYRETEIGQYYYYLLFIFIIIRTKLLHDDVILLQLPESLSLLFSCAN